MATIVLQAAGTVLGTMLGGPVGGMIGGAIGAAIGGVVDSFALNALFAPKAIRQEGPRLSGIQIQSSQEGAGIKRVFGGRRIAGELIWATRFTEVVSTDTAKVGGKGGAGGGGQKVVTTSYAYYCSFAIGLCEGPIQRIGDIWVDGKLMDLATVTYRVYNGTETQNPDVKIAAIEGVAFTPAYRGLAYIVFEELALERYGNRLPQITVEVFAKPEIAGVQDASPRIKSVLIAPGLSEFGYATSEVTDTLNEGDGIGWNENSTGSGNSLLNNHSNDTLPDFVKSVSNLGVELINAETVALTVTWFYDDLRAPNCLIQPRVETLTRSTTPYSWVVSGINRAGALPINSYHSGGTPSDRSLFEAIQHLKGLGYKVLLRPTIVGSIDLGNTLPNPYSNNASTAEQPLNPTSNLVTCSPATGFTGSPEGTITARTQLNTLVGSTLPGSFGVWDGNTIPFTGSPTDFSYRRMILHYARLAYAANVDVFLIGSSLKGLTSVRGESNTFPMVEALCTLAADVSSILGVATKVSYAAAWDEYHSIPKGNSIYFNLDPLWSHSSVAFIGIDYFFPVTDWRDDAVHLDRQTWKSVNNIEYIAYGLTNGEFADWIYVSDADRNAQIRTTITDPFYSKHWVYAPKKIKDWWSNSHYNRVANVEELTPTGWVLQSKPIWLTAIGCPAINKGTNYPAVDTSSGSINILQYPYYSTLANDPTIQLQFLYAIYNCWDDISRNPVSVVYGESMIDLDNIIINSWDHRPWPAYPRLTDAWNGTDKWYTAHTISGRVSMISVQSIIEALTPAIPLQLDSIYGFIYGYLLERPVTARAAIEPLASAFFFDAFESDGMIKFAHRSNVPTVTIDVDSLVDNDGDEGPYILTRAQETELPVEVSIGFIDPEQAYEASTTHSRRGVSVGSDRQITVELPLVISREEAQFIGDTTLTELWIRRERFSASLPPSLLRLDPSDTVTIVAGGNSQAFRIEELGYEYVRPVSAARTDTSIYYNTPRNISRRNLIKSNKPRAGLLEFIDIPLINLTDREYAPWVAIHASPWNSFNVFKSPSTDYTFDSNVPTASVVGVVQAVVNPGVHALWDMQNSVVVRLLGDTVLQSLDDLTVLGGANKGAMKGTSGEWEVFQWRTAEFVGTKIFRLSGLLRAQFGTEGAMQSLIPQNAPFVLLEGLTQTNVNASHFRNVLNWKFGPSTRDIGDSTYKTTSYYNGGINTRPLSPSHLSASKNPSNDIILTWIRRDRKDADNWELIEVPMSESIELYDIEILNAALTADVRTIVDHPSPEFTYTQAMQIADHGGLINAIGFRVYQKSTVYGRGQIIFAYKNL